MTIKEELKERLQEARENNAKKMEEERKLSEKEPRKLIEEFIIPKFREIAAELPLETELKIRFIQIGNRLIYSSRIERIESLPYEGDVIYQAAIIAKEYDIQAEIHVDMDEVNTYFSLNLW